MASEVKRKRHKGRRKKGSKLRRALRRRRQSKK